MLDDGLDAAIGDFVFITDLVMARASGSPIQRGLDDLATLADCDDPAAEMLYGQFEADDGPAPDATNDGFFARCDGLESDAEFDVIGNARYIISPLTDNWEALDRRTVLCIAGTTWMGSRPKNRCDPTPLTQSARFARTTTRPSASTRRYRATNRTPQSSPDR